MSIISYSKKTAVENIASSVMNAPDLEPIQSDESLPKVELVYADYKYNESCQ